MKKGNTRFLDWIKRNSNNLTVGLIILIALGLRIGLYGDMRLSIGTNDTSSYYSQSNIPLFSWEAWTSRRLPGYPMFFRLFQPEDGYPELTSISYPAAPGVGVRSKAFQPGFDTVVVAQALIAMASWVIFVLVLCRHLKTKILRPIAAGVILLFAFSPALAEWDSILMSESVSFSLFTLLIALSLELFFRVSAEKKSPAPLTKILMILWALLVPLWAFMRDSNSQTLIVLVVFFILFLVVPGIRREIPIFWTAAIGLWILFLYGWYSYTTAAANRWTWGWFDIYNHWISIVPARKQFFLDRGMPDQWTDEWVRQSGTKTYFLFLASHPGFMVTELLGRLSDAFSENVQPFFFTYPTLLRNMVLAIGDMFHPLSSTAFLFPIFSGILVIIAAIRNSFSQNRHWFWLVLWLICMVYAQYAASFFGDSGGLIRHTLGAVVYMRLMIWLLPIILAEIISPIKNSRKKTASN
jgi:hypothetical protein